MAAHILSWESKNLPHTTATQIQALVAFCFRRPFPDPRADPQGNKWFVVEYKDVTVACCCVHGETLWNLCVHPEYQRKRVGTVLLRHVLKRYQSLDLYVERSNRGARIFYEKHGFKVLGGKTRVLHMQRPPTGDAVEHVRGVLHQ